MVTDGVNEGAKALWLPHFPFVYLNHDSQQGVLDQVIDHVWGKPPGSVTNAQESSKISGKVMLRRGIACPQPVQIGFVKLKKIHARASVPPLQSRSADGRNTDIDALARLVPRIAR